MNTTETKGALEGIRVVDFSWALAGPLAARIMADHGAQVIKIERPGGEIARFVPPFPEESGVNRSGIFNNMNRNKYGMTLDVQNPRGLELAKKLISTSHVVVENYASGVVEKWGLGYEELCKVKPDIILASMPAYGHSGPYRDHIGYGQTLHTLSGWFDLIGYAPDQPPTGIGFAYSDYIGGCLAATMVMAALHRWRKTGEGSYIEVPQFEALCAMLGPAFLDYFVNQRVAQRSGNRLPPNTRAAAPHGAYPCKGDDRWCTIAVFTDEEWKAFCKAIGEPEWVRDAKFSTILSRMENADELDQRVGEWTKNRAPDEVMETLQKAGVAAGAVREIRDLVDSDAQMKEYGLYKEADHAELGKRLFEENPFRLSDTPSQIDRGSPLLGEHNDFVCKDVLGLSEEEINQYIIEGVLG
ncbi:CaiB/BaiF CoA transferase family protein [Thermodesulfobacteriota bacterium]